MQVAENTKDDTISSEKPKTESVSTEKVEESTSSEPKTSRRAKARGIELGNAGERLQIAQQAMRLLQLSGVLISQKTVSKSQKTAIILIIEGCTVCDKCGWWAVGDKCQNPRCEVFAKNLVGEILAPIKDAVANIEKPEIAIEKPKNENDSELHQQTANTLLSDE